MTAENPTVLNTSLVERIKGILLQPKLEWPVIEAEHATVDSLFRRYALPLAAIGPLANLVHEVIDDGPSATLLLYTAITYGLNLLVAYILGIVIDGVAHNFGAEKNMLQSMKVAVYSLTPFWLLGIVNLLSPGFAAFLTLTLGFYGAYLVYTGVKALKKVPDDKQLSYTVAASIIWVLLTMVVFGLGAAVFGAFSIVGQGAAFMAGF